MTVRLLYGKPIAAALLDTVRTRVQELTATLGRAPTLAIVRTGDDPDVAVYTRSLLRACRASGLQGVDVHLEATVDERSAVQRVRQLGDDRTVDAILIQTPLVPAVRREALLGVLPPVKDVDGLTDESAGLLLRGAPRHVPATAKALLLLAQRSGRELAGARAVVVGRSNVVGLPAALLLLRDQATVTICHRGTRDLAAETRRAGLLVVATGRPGLVTGDMVAPGAVVLDAGTTMTEQGLRGDVDAATVGEVAAVLTPVPGGVGPLTTAVLLEQVVAAAEERAGR